MAEAVDQGALERFLVSAYDSPERPLEKVLARSVNDELWAVQLWYRDEREPEGFFLRISEDFDDS
jgi:hypothetical protein